MPPGLKQYLSGKRLRALLILWICLSADPGFSLPVTLGKAIGIAENFLAYQAASGSFDLKQMVPKTFSGQTVGYLAALSPGGYILVAADTIRVPVKAYSFESNFDNLPPWYIEILLQELYVPNPVTFQSNFSGSTPSPLPEAVNQSYWDFLSQPAVHFSAMAGAYSPDTHLLETQWDQGVPYNKLTPKIGDEPTWSGCTQVALSQIMRYHKHPERGSGVFTHTWNGQTLTAVMNRPFNWDIMPQKVTGQTPGYQRDEVAALLRDLAIFNGADFGIDATTTSFSHNNFAQAFGYAQVKLMGSDQAGFFPTIKDEIDNLRPMILSLAGAGGGSGGHATVADGYASDGSGKKIHLNLGWGGTYDGYYYLDQTNAIGSYVYGSTGQYIYYNIRPCQSGECTFFEPEENDQSPVFIAEISDQCIDGPTTFRLDAVDPDGDTVMFSASSSSNNLQLEITGNLLNVTPTATGFFLCTVAITANSYDGKATQEFKVLSLNKKVYTGNDFDIGGVFATQSDTQVHSAYLNGYTTITGYRGYSDQGFYVQIGDQEGNVVVPWTDDTISNTFSSGIYTIFASITNAATGYYYSYDIDYSDYTLSISTQGQNAVPVLADQFDISLSDDGPFETPCAKGIFPDYDLISGGGGTKKVVVTTSRPDCTWSTSHTLDWVTLSPSCGTGSMVVNVIVAQETGAVPRSGQITVAGNTYTLDQAAGVPCDYTVDPLGGSFSGAGGSQDIELTASSASCQWTVSGKPSWAGVSPKSGSGSQTITISVDDNIETTSRTGKITIAGQTYMITQDPAVPQGVQQISIVSPADNDTVSCWASGGSVPLEFTKIPGVDRYLLHFRLYDILNHTETDISQELFPSDFSDTSQGMAYDLILDSGIWDVLALFDVLWGVEAYDATGERVGSTFGEGYPEKYVSRIKFIPGTAIAMTSPSNGSILAKTANAPIFQWNTDPGVATYTLILAHAGTQGFDTVIAQDNLNLDTFPVDAATWQSMPAGTWYWTVLGYDASGKQMPGAFTIFDFVVNDS